MEQAAQVSSRNDGTCHKKVIQKMCEERGDGAWERDVARENTGKGRGEGTRRDRENERGRTFI